MNSQQRYLKYKARLPLTPGSPDLSKFHAHPEGQQTCLFFEPLSCSQLEEEQTLPLCCPLGLLLQPVLPAQC